MDLEEGDTEMQSNIPPFAIMWLVFMEDFLFCFHWTICGWQTDTKWTINRWWTNTVYKCWTHAELTVNECWMIIFYCLSNQLYNYHSYNDMLSSMEPPFYPATLYSTNWSMNDTQLDTDASICILNVCGYLWVNLIGAQAVIKCEDWVWFNW